MSPSPEPPRSQAPVVGWALVSLGVLMTLLCGACTLTFWGIALSGYQSPNALGAMLMLFLFTGLIGGLPTAAGVVLIWAGWRILHPKALSRQRTEDTFT